MRFIVEFVVFGAIMIASALPVVLVAKRLQRRVRPPIWAASAALCALAVAIVGWSSRDLTQKCLQERNEGCIDFGGTGTQFVIVAGYVIFALATAFLLSRD